MTIDPKKAIQNRVILMVGEEESLRRRAIDDLLQAVGMARDDFDLQNYVADAAPPQEWIGSVGMAPFLAERRVVIVRNLLRVESDTIRPSDLAALPEHSLLVLVADEEIASEDRLQRMRTTVRKGWEKLVGSAGGLVQVFDPNQKSTKAEVLNEAKRLGVKLTPSAADALVEMTGGSFSRASDEMEKLSLFVGEGAQIRESDVRELVVPSREWNVFKMVEATLQGHVPEALRHLRVLVSATSKPEDVAMRSILPVVSNQLRLIWQARLLLEAGRVPMDAPEELTALFPAKPNLLKEKDWRQNRAMASAKYASLDKLEECFQILSDTDARLKGLLNGFNVIETLELMVLEMSGTLSSRTSASR